MWHATYTQVNQGDSQLLVVNNQIGSLIPNLFFTITYVLSTSNGSCNPIIDIYTLKAFQQYKNFSI
jgi:hypothetical protein